MLRIFKHFVPMTTLALWVVEALLISLALFWGLFPGEASLVASPVGPAQFATFIAMLGFLAVLGLLSMTALGLYNHDAFLDFRSTLTRLLLVAVVLFPVAMAAKLLLSNALTADVAPLAFYLKAVGLPLACILLTRAAFRQIAASERHKRRVIVLGSGVKARQILERVENQTNRHFTTTAFVHACDDPPMVAVTPIDPNDTNALAKLGRSLKAVEVVLATDDRRGLPVAQLLQCKIAGLAVIDYLTFWEREYKRVDLDALRPSWLLFSDGFASSSFSRWAKRVLDVSVSLGMLFFTFPVLVATAVLIRLESPGPVLYRQVRVGQGGQPFTLLKFRSMRVDAEREGAPQWAAHRDPRVTRIGAFIRLVRIDELPQLFNVLSGDMSFVGPRPERPFFVEQLAQDIPFYNERHAVKPGITGWAQVNYPYGASLEDARNKLSFDLYYVKNRSLFLDFLIIVQTVRVILWQSGAR